MSFEKPWRRSRREVIAAALGAGVFVALTALGLPHPSAKQPPGKGETTPPAAEAYPVHNNITTTVFWAGEDRDASNDYISNGPSAWVENWAGEFGGLDDPKNRCGYRPCAFVPKENTFYFALPFDDYTDKGPKSAAELKVVPWFSGQLKDGESILKNRWIEVTFNGKKAYAQWEDVGPFVEDDAGYVFGTDRPKDSRAGLDVSPAVSDYLGLDGEGETSWRFIDESEIPPGPWKDVITRSGPNWGS